MAPGGPPGPLHLDFGDRPGRFSWQREVVREVENPSGVKIAVRRLSDGTRRVVPLALVRAGMHDAPVRRPCHDVLEIGDHASIEAKPGEALLVATSFRHLANYHEIPALLHVLPGSTPTSRETGPPAGGDEWWWR